jgi:hypothetical protein
MNRYGLPVDASGRLGVAAHESLHAIIGGVAGREIGSVIMLPEVATHFSRTDAAACTRLEMPPVGQEFAVAIPTLASAIAPDVAGCPREATWLDVTRAHEFAQSLSRFDQFAGRDPWAEATGLVHGLLARKDVIEAIEWMTCRLAVAPWMDFDEVREIVAPILGKKEAEQHVK